MWWYPGQEPLSFDLYFFFFLSFLHVPDESQHARQAGNNSCPSLSLPPCHHQVKFEQWTDSKDNKVQKETEANDLDLKSPGY
jgi:hypothetical protein